MKSYLIGGVAGYLITSIFNIPSPPAIFWWVLASGCVVILYGYIMAYWMNNDHYGDIDE
jgi:hypothetical protein